MFMTELRQSERYGEYLKKIGWVVEKQGKVQAFIRTIPLLPISVMKIQRASIEDLDWEWIRSISRKHKVMVNYIEPVEAVDEIEHTSLLVKHGYRAIKNGMLPTKTQGIDLRFKIQDLRMNFKSKTRYNLGLAVRKGLVAEIKTGKEMLEDEVAKKAYLEIIRTNAGRVGYWAVPDKWVQAKFDAFREDCFGVFVKNKNEVVAVALFLCTDTGCYYSLNGSTKEGRMLFAPTLAIWAAIQESIKRNLLELDFDGVYDERFPNTRWLGYTRFKAGFGGQYIYYAPAYIKWLPGRD
jgi:hypothetical protein